MVNESQNIEKKDKNALKNIKSEIIIIISLQSNKF